MCSLKWKLNFKTMCNQGRALLWKYLHFLTMKLGKWDGFKHALIWPFIILMGKKDSEFITDNWMVETIDILFEFLVIVISTAVFKCCHSLTLSFWVWNFYFPVKICCILQFYPFISLLLLSSFFFLFQKCLDQEGTGSNSFIMQIF